MTQISNTRSPSHPLTFTLEFRCVVKSSDTPVTMYTEKFLSTGSEVRKFTAQKRKTLTRVRDELTDLKGRLRETLETVGYVAERGDPVPILSIRRGISHHMNTLLDLKCTIPNPSHKLSIKVKLNSPMACISLRD